MKRWALLVFSTVLAACASYDGRGLEPGVATLDTVIQTMGPPAMRWQDTDGSVQLSYPRGPSSPESFMVWVDRAGKLQRIENVLRPEIVAKIMPGMSKEQVLRLIGPSIPGRTVYFKSRDELVWEWRYQEGLGEYAHLSVLFDATKGTVRSTIVTPDVKVSGPT